MNKSDKEQAGKILVIGPTMGSSLWRDMIKAELPCDKIIFLGEYFTSPFKTTKQSLAEYLEISYYKNMMYDKVILLRSLWDTGYLKLDNLNIDLDLPINFPRTMLTNDTQWCYKSGNIFFSSKGITQQWVDHLHLTLLNTKSKINSLVTQINKNNDFKYFTIFEQGTYTEPNYSCLNGDNIKKSVKSISHPDMKYIQVVSRNQFSNEYKIDKDGVLFYCVPSVPTKEYLVIEGDEFTFKKLK